MSYEGEIVQRSFALPFAKVQVVIVSGARLNPCGHALLFVDGRYFHVADPSGYGYPRRIPNDVMYRVYLKENRKREIRRMLVQVPDATAAQEKLAELLASKWFWGGAVNNCVVFVEDVLHAGGSDWSCWHNCPAVCGSMP